MQLPNIGVHIARSVTCVSQWCNYQQITAFFVKLGLTAFLTLRGISFTPCLVPFQETKQESEGN